MAEEQKNTAEPEAVQGQMAIQKIYCKDVSFETPNSPDIFKTEWKPDVHMNLGTETKKVADDIYEVVLRVTLTVKSGEDVAYLCEVHQAGIFNIVGMADEQLNMFLGILCPNILFPYSRATVSSLVSEGGFPQMQLQPVNFELLYQQSLQQKAAENGTSH